MRVIEDLYQRIAQNPGVFIHQGNNGRRGSIFVLCRFVVEKATTPVLQFYEVYCASQDRIGKVDNRYSIRSLREGDIPPICRYAIRNLEEQFLVMNGQEKHFHEPMLRFLPLDEFEELYLPDHSAGSMSSKILEVTKHCLEKFYLTHNLKNPINTKEGKRTMSINLKTAAAIVDESTTTIEVALSNRDGVVPERYTFLCKQELALTLDEDDLVLVQASNGTGVKVAVVAAVHTEPNVELNSDINYKWAFQKVDTTKLDNLVAVHDKLHQMLKDRQRVTTRQSVMASLGITPEDLLALSHTSARPAPASFMKVDSGE